LRAAFLDLPRLFGAERRCHGKHQPAAPKSCQHAPRLSFHFRRMQWRRHDIVPLGRRLDCGGAKRHRP
jgi:hypothetical protein